MIRAIITDIDGVLIGNQQGVNFPHPSQQDCATITALQEKGIPVVTCSAKAYFSIEPILIQPLNMVTLHLSDAGALITDAKLRTQTVLGEIEPNVIADVLKVLTHHNVYFEVYTPTAYYATPYATDHQSIYNKRLANLGFLPLPFTDLAKSAEPFIKLYTLPVGNQQNTIVSDIAKSYLDKLSLHWGKNPSEEPELAAFFTAATISKEEGIKKIVERLGIPFDDILSIGDSTNDWNFMKLCGYKATLRNGTDILRNNVVTVKEKDHGYLSDKSIAENGFTDIVNHFALIQ
jgi:hydroxymethylpyrimidine pyrophosphatase-like HAD family hydrolase